MTQQDSELGALQKVYGISPIFIQRAVIVAALSFIFFLAMLIAFSLVQKFVFFWLATAFLVIELLTLFGWLTQRRSEIRIYEKGFTFKRQNFLWSEIESISLSRDKQKNNYELKLSDGKKIVMTGAVHGVEDFIKKAELKTGIGRIDSSTN